MAERTIEQYMTKSPHTIGHEQTLAVAHRMMNDFGIRHLPVLESGNLVGMVTERDLHLIETLRDVDPSEVKVSEAMTQSTYSVGPRTTVRKVAKEMAEHKYGSVVVIDKDRIVGVFTAVDALRALSALLDGERALAC